VKRISGAWVGRAVVAVLLAVFLNAILDALSVDHDESLVALLALASVAAGALTMAALETETRTAWTVRRSDALPSTGEDTRTAMYRHVIEVHLTSQDADDAIVWQVADLAKHRLRQLHGLRFEESPERVTELLGPVLAEWVSHDRRHRYVPGARHRRYTVAQLGDAVRRIEEL
jgi:hypothetical protein